VIQVGSTLKNFLAALGVFFLVLIVISLLVTLLYEDSSIGFGDKVGVVTIEGIITEPTYINNQINDLAERDDIKAIVLRIDSPGGAVGPAQEIYREVQKLKDQKHVVVSMGSVAASGGYYIASAADKIVSNPGTITGSIGVIVEFINLEELLSKIGLKGQVIKSAKYKDIGSPFRSMKDEENRLIKKVLDDVHKQFVEAVAEGRGMKVEEVGKLADGRIFSGAQAKRLGLVDQLGNMNDAINLGAELAGIEGKPRVVYTKRRMPGLFSTLFGDYTGQYYRELLAGMLPGGFRIMYLLKEPSG
jgi:protease-4